MAQLKAIGADAEHFPGDLSQTLACEQLVERFAARFGGIDVLVNNAGGLVGRKQLSEIDDEFFSRHRPERPLGADGDQIRLAASDCFGQGEGKTASVILVGSIAGYTGGGPGASLYAASKALVALRAKTGSTLTPGTACVST